MKRLTVLMAVLVGAFGAGAAEEKKTPKEALQPFNDLIGSWRSTGEPSGTREEKLKGFWQEKIAWQWQFKGGDAWLRADLDKGKYFTKAELHYLPERDLYRMTCTTPDKEELVFEGKLEKKRLTVERTDPKTKQAQRIVLTLLHSNRYLTRYEVRPADHTVFSPVYQVGSTKEGVAFASDGDRPECVVSGGLGTMPVTYKGKTYYVCCSGCRDAFRDEPEKYIADYEERMKEKKKKE